MDGTPPHPWSFLYVQLLEKNFAATLMVQSRKTNGHLTDFTETECMRKGR